MGSAECPGLLMTGRDPGLEPIRRAVIGDTRLDGEEVRLLLWWNEE